MKSRVLLIMGAALLVTACDAGAAQTQYVRKDYIVTEAPVIQQDACYLRVRPAYDSTGAPRVFRYRMDNANDDLVERTSAVEFGICKMSKIGDQISDFELASTEPATPAPAQR